MKTHAITRRTFLHSAASAATSLTLAPALARAAGARPTNAAAFSFVLLGDLHYDKLEHHDLAWLDRKHPNDLSQIKNYTRVTAEIMPRLFATLRESITELNRSPATAVAFVLQVGDLVEGLCGSEERSVRQNTEVLEFVRGARLGAPFLFAKGNHDITGDGAREAFAGVFHPFLTEQRRALRAGAEAVSSARYTVEVGNAQFAFFDAYESAESLEWFEAVAAKRTAEHLFTIVHPPVVPYGARATWTVFAAEKERAKREKFLALLGDQHAIVLGGHIHKYNVIAREAGRGRFAQFALSSVVNAPAVVAKTELTGIAKYNGEQIKVEPNFGPGTDAARQAIYAAEQPFVKAFEYADLPGYAVVTVDGARVTVRMFSGIGHEVWRSVDLSGLTARA